MVSFVHAEVHDATLRRVRRGQDVLLVGDAGAGKSMVLRELRATLRGSGTVIEIPGSGDAVPLGAFLSHPTLAPRAGSRFGVPEATAALTDAIGPGDATLLIDDAHTLDAVSSTVLDAVVRRHPDRIRVVGAVPLEEQSSRSLPRVLMSAPTDVVPPLTVAEVATLLTDLLEGPVEGSLATAIAGRSGGNPRVARELVLAAADDDAVALVHGRWAQVGSLDNVPTAALVGVLIADLDDALREGLETIAWFGLLGIENARHILGDGALAALDRAGRLAVFERASENLIAVSPPVLGHALRLHLTPTRRAMIRARADEALGTTADETPGHTLPDEVELLPRRPEDHPVHQQVTVLTESMRTRLAVCRKQWNERRDVASALPLLRLRMLDGFGSVDIDRVFAETVRAASDLPEEVASYVLLRGQWRAIRGASIVDGLLTDPGPSGELVLPDCGEAFLGQLAAMYDGSGAANPSMDAVDDERDVPPSLWGFAAILRVQAAIEAGAPDHALELIDRWQGSVRQRPFDHQLNALRTDALLMVGQVDDALAWSRERLSDAYDELSPFAVRLAARGLATALFIAGDHERAQRALSVVLRLGRCGPAQSPFDERIFALAAVLHAHTGHHDLARTLLDELDATPRPYAPTFDFMRPWAHTEVACALTGTADPEPLWQAGDRLWDEGRRASAVFSWALTPQRLSTSRFDRLTDAFGTIRAPILRPLLRVHEALAHGTGTEIVDTARALNASGAVRWAAANVARDRAAEDGVQFSAEQYAEIAGGAVAASDLPPSTSLTAREQEIVDLVREGLSNRDIAAQLFLSVRTVESHLYRAMQKLGVNDRRQLTNADAADRG